METARKVKASFFTKHLLRRGKTVPTIPYDGPKVQPAIRLRATTVGRSPGPLDNLWADTRLEMCSLRKADRGSAADQGGPPHPLLESTHDFCPASILRGVSDRSWLRPCANSRGCKSVSRC